MVNYFECKIKYAKMLDNGKVKKVTEPYLVEAYTCTEGEANTIKSLRPYISEDFSVTSVKETKYAEIINNAAAYFYAVKYSATTLEEGAKEERKVLVDVLVGADDLEDALKKFKESMKNFNNYEIVSVSLTPFVEVILKEQ